MGERDPRRTREYDEPIVTVAALLGRQPGPVGVSEQGPAPGPPGRNRLVLLAAGSAGVAVVLAVVLVHVSVSARSSADAAVAGPPRLLLTTSQVHVGGSYFATVEGFAPGESVRFSWTGPTSGVMGAYDADSAGHSGVRGRIVEQDPPGNYEIIATGLTSGRRVADPLQVLAAEH